MAHLRETLSYEPVQLAFGTSGLRGLVRDMTDLECYINCVGFLNFLVETEGLAKGSKVYLAGDLRSSTPRILTAIHKAITDSGFQTVHCGFIPTPTLAYYAFGHHAPSVMVTGSHIPDDRNGIKFQKSQDEVLKGDEAGINQAVAAVRERLYNGEATTSQFTADGMLKDVPSMPEMDPAAAANYVKRYTDVFGDQALKGVQLVFYEHSTVGRDILPDVFTKLGAEVIGVDRSDVFKPIDSENVTPDDQRYFKHLAQKYPHAFAILSADGDADRPFVIDAGGVFHRGDVLGAVVAEWLKLDTAAFPVSASDAVESHLNERSVTWQHTRIGSPYVISAMAEAVRSGGKRVGGWEVNGGFLLGSDIKIGSRTLKALPTRDALLPMIVALIAAREANTTVAELFAALPQRYTQAGLLDNFPPETYKAILDRFAQNNPDAHKNLGNHFSAEHGFGAVSHINTLDGIRIYFEGGDVAHMRQSSNAPQLRLYSVADTQQRADEIVAKAINEQGGIFRKLQSLVEGEA